MAVIGSEMVGHEIFPSLTTQYCSTKYYLGPTLAFPQGKKTGWFFDNINFTIARVIKNLPSA